MCSGIVESCVSFSACGTRSGVVKFRVIYFCLKNVLYFSTCGTRSGIVGFCAIYFSRVEHAMSV